MRIIAGEARGKPLLSPRDRTARPPLARLRESLFASLGDSVVDRAVLDLFAGVGAFGLEAVSRGARRAVFVERDPNNFDLLRRNIERLGFSARCRAIRGDALRVPELSREPAASLGLVFLDPPFNMFALEREEESLRDRVREILASAALAPGSLVVLRTPADAKVEAFFPEMDSRTYGASKILVARTAPAEPGRDPPA